MDDDKKKAQEAKWRDERRKMQEAELRGPFGPSEGPGARPSPAAVNPTTDEARATHSADQAPCLDEPRRKEAMKELEKAGLPQAELFRLHETQRTGLAPATESPFKTHGQRPQIVNIPTGRRFRARFLGPIFPVWLHFLEDKKSFPCFGTICKKCPAYRTLYGYAPVLTFQLDTLTGEEKNRRAALSLWQSTCAHLEELGVRRGTLVEFYRGKKDGDLRIEVIENQSEYILPPTFDLVREVLIPRWGLPYWPDQGFQPSKRESTREDMGVG